jgi:uncharacterized protein (UPF0548 family)
LTGTAGPTYAPLGATAPGDERWSERPGGLRAFERTVHAGSGDEYWERASAALREWGVKTRSGFIVQRSGSGGPTVEPGADFRLVARLGPLTVHEPVRVVAVVDHAERRGFAYGTLPGHPVSGEEAFILHRTSDGEVWFTLRSLTSPAAGRWRLLYPVLLVAQSWYRRRYVRSLRRLG